MRECNLATGQQEIERLRREEDELWNTTKGLGELRQFLSTVKSEIDSMHQMMPAQEQDTLVGKENTRSSNNSETGIGDKQSEMMELWQSVALLQAGLDRAQGEAAKFQTDNEQLKDELLSDVNQGKLLHGRLEALHAELQEIETRVDICAGELRLVSVHLVPNFPKYNISQPDEGPEGRVAKKVRCLIEQALLKLPRFESQLAAKKPIEPNKVDIDARNCMDNMQIAPLRRAGTLGSDTEQTLYNTEQSPVVSPERHSTDGPADTIVVASGTTDYQHVGALDERKTPDVDETSLRLETFRLTVLLHPLSAISSTGDEASLTLKSLLKVKTVYSPEMLENSDLASIDSAIEATRKSKASLSRALDRMTFQGRQVFSEPWLETYKREELQINNRIRPPPAQIVLGGSKLRYGNWKVGKPRPKPVEINHKIKSEEATEGS
ncbi:hypothetical protein FOXB_12629 [Fusarium oxysporum f. sp. conglutinans Fo5176]|uniref:Uncharacterized protein n=1 Tax=Fusarium oxysporum (strain Fo5176) TaxID=660025 RepID=F9G1U7_FUSOF|nr:hypothetical protein FOXB_12629 [Fusarium oxysporum f. sp. conglutinans Fo5176]